MNNFHHKAEWIPFFFSILVPFPLILELIINRKRDIPLRLLGQIAGYSSITVGIAGLLFHLNSNFFEIQTLKSLVYTAPFIAPLAYCGLGFLLLLNRSIDSQKHDWCQWLIFLGTMGFVGNFILSLCDHAQNGFFHTSEWIPVFSAAFAIGFLIPTLINQCSKKYLIYCLWIMAIQAIIGIIGFILHAMAIKEGYSSDLFKNIVHSAPIFAPLLFTNLALLTSYGLYTSMAHTAK